MPSASTAVALETDFYRNAGTLLAVPHKLLAAANMCGGVGWVNSCRCQTTTLRTRLPQQLLCSHLFPACLPHCRRCTTHRHYCGEPSPKILKLMSVASPVFPRDSRISSLRAL